MHFTGLLLYESTGDLLWVPPGAHGRKACLPIPAIGKLIREINKWKAKIIETAELWKEVNSFHLSKGPVEVGPPSQNVLTMRASPVQMRTQKTWSKEPIHP